MLIQIIDQPTGGGAEKICRELSSSINDLDGNIKIIYLKNPNNIVLNSFENFCDYGFGYIGSIFYLRKTIKSYCKDSSFNLIVHGHLSKPLYLIPLATFGFKCIKVFTEHNTHYRRRKYKILKSLEQIIYKQYDRVICVSNGVADHLINWLNDDSLNSRISVIYNGLKTNEVEYKASVNSVSEYKFLSIGSLTEQKGFDLSINALSKLNFDNWSYDILGEGPKESELKNLVQHCGLSNNVAFHGYKDNIDDFLQKSDFMLIPSRWEGFGLVVIEALASGLTIICSDVSGMNEITKDNSACIMVKPNDYLDLLSGINKAIIKFNDVDQSTKSKFLVQDKFTHDFMVKEYLKLYKELED